MDTPKGLRFRLEHRFARSNLSAYLDDRLSDRDGARLERHLAECPECCANLQSLRATVSLMKGIPLRRVPCSFALPASAAAEQASHKRWNRAYGVLRTATTVAAAFVVLLVAGDALLGSALRGLPAPAAEPVAVQQAYHAAAEEGVAMAVPAQPTRALEQPTPSAAAAPMIADAAPDAAQPTAPAVALAAPAPAASEPALARGEAPAASEPPAATGDEPVEETAYGEHPPAPPGMGGGYGGEGSVGGYPGEVRGGGGMVGGPIMGLAPTTGAEAGVAAAGTTGEPSEGVTDPGAMPPPPDASAEPSSGEATAAAEETAKDAATEQVVAPAESPPAATAAPAMPATALAASPAAEPTTPSLAMAAPVPADAQPTPAPGALLRSGEDAEATARDVTAIEASPMQAAAPQAAVGDVPAEAPRDVYGLAPQDAAGVWRGVRLGAAVGLGVLLVLLSGTVWTGFQRRA